MRIFVSFTTRWFWVLFLVNSKTLLQAFTALTVQLPSLLLYWDDNSNQAKLIIRWMTKQPIDGCGLQFLGYSDIWTQSRMWFLSANSSITSNYSLSLQVSFGGSPPNKACKEGLFKSVLECPSICNVNKIQIDWYFWTTIISIPFIVIYYNILYWSNISCMYNQILHFQWSDAFTATSRDWSLVRVGLLHEGKHISSALSPPITGSRRWLV